ncbi:hypothetical protein CCP3SC1AL1_4250002 [Gammaproteobacteria bacterium]
MKLAYSCRAKKVGRLLDLGVDSDLSVDGDNLGDLAVLDGQLALGPIAGDQEHLRVGGEGSEGSSAVCQLN